MAFLQGQAHRPRWLQRGVRETKEKELVPVHGLRGTGAPGRGTSLYMRLKTLIQL